MSKTSTSAPADASGTPAAPSRIGPKLKIAAFILGVAAVEWVVAYVYLPSVAPATPPAAEKHAAEETHEEHEEEAPAEDRRRTREAWRGRRAC